VKLRVGVPSVLAVVGLQLLPGVFEATEAHAGTSPAPTLGSSRVPVAPEYFTDTWSDPMDMSNPEDFDTTPGRRAVGVNAGMANGVLSYTSTWGAGRLYFADSAPNELKVLEHREATHRPIDSARLSRLSVRAYTDRDIVGFIVWDHCAGPVPGGACQGTKAFHLRAGWHLYDLDLTGANDADSYTDATIPQSISGTPWTHGGVVRLGWQPSATGVAGVSGVIDSVRVYQPGVALVNVANSSGTRNLWYDLNSSTTDNGSAANQGSGAGVLRYNLPGGTSTVDAGALPAGTYHLELETGGAFSAASRSLAIDPAPMPVVLDPDVSGGGDWYTATRGKPMDFSTPDDLFWMFDGGLNVRNTDVGVWDDWLHASSAGNFSDPQVFLTNAFWAGPLLDAEEWHRITWRVQYEGTWGTNAVPGQGLDTRFCWFLPNGPASCSKDVFPSLGPQIYSVDLKTDNPAEVENAGYSGAGFGGPASHWVHLLRLDPHEDPGARSWHIDEVRISHDDRIPAGGAFPIRFVDRAHEDGSFAVVYVDTDQSLWNGATPIAEVATHAGENVVHWDGAGVAPARYWVHVVITDPNGANRAQTSTGPLDLPDPAKWSPAGGFDAIVPGGRRITALGWTIDPDWVRDPTTVHLYVDGVGYDLGPANAPNPILGAMRSDAGPHHSYSHTVEVGSGVHDVCAVAINFGHGANSALGCRSVLVK
jgi:hypothetical protein